ncbi:hypothetical protein LSAT2_019146, partial [Lamellibrachia satsuma]
NGGSWSLTPAVDTTEKGVAMIMYVYNKHGGEGMAMIVYIYNRHDGERDGHDRVRLQQT